MAKVAYHEKRFGYVSHSEQEELTTEDSDCGDDFYGIAGKTATKDNKSIDGSDEDHWKKSHNKTNKPKRRPRCQSKNALMARENRIKKKMYIESLERNIRALKSSNKKLSTIADEQSFAIRSMQRQIKYLKSVLANSSDICLLMKNINNNTGMSVNTSLGQNFMLSDDACVSNPKHMTTPHPWEDSGDFENNFSFETNALLKDCHYKSNYSDEVADLFPEIEETLTSDLTPIEEVLKSEHNYTIREDFGKMDDDVGVCLHVSKHRVSLEFCPTCSENALQAWKKD